MTPRTDTWKPVTLASVHALDQLIWLRCNICGHELLSDPLAFAGSHGLNAGTPLLIIARRLVCTRCGERKENCWPEPYAIRPRV